MKLVKIEQRSEEWLEYRQGKSGGSEFKDLWIPGLPLKAKIIEKLEQDGQPLSPEDKKLTVARLAEMLEPAELAELKLEPDPKRKYYEIIADSVARPITPNDYVDRLGGREFSMMARGEILEPEARAAFEKSTGKKLDAETHIWEDEQNPNIYISPDGYITGKDGKIREAVEIKCLSSWEIIKAYLTGSYPKEYEPQALKYFMVNKDLETLYFVLYTDLIPGLEIQIFEIHREDVEPRIAEAKAFEYTVMQYIAKDIEKIKELSF